MRPMPAAGDAGRPAGGADRRPAGAVPGATRRRCWRWTTSGWSRRSRERGSADEAERFLAELRPGAGAGGRRGGGRHAGLPPLDRVPHPAAAARRHARRPVHAGPGRPRPRGALTRPGGRPRGQPQGVAARDRDGAPARAGAWPRRGSRWSAGSRSASTPAPTWARWRARACRSRSSAAGPDVVYPRTNARLHERIAAAGPARVRAAARPAPVPLELPGAQPDHGRPLRGDGGGRGRGGVGVADHDGVRRGPRPDRRRGAGAGRCGNGRGAATRCCAPARR